jgi:hypothetical protein
MQLEVMQGEVAEQVQEQSMETQLAGIGSSRVALANAMVITDQASAQAAANFLTGLKADAKRITAYWKEPKDAAKAAHQNLVNLEKAMLDPLTVAEGVVKKKVLAYNTLEEEKRRAAAAEAARLQKEERDRMLAQAVEAEKTGDEVGVAAHLAMASVVEDMAAPVSMAAPKVAGIAQRKTWKARVTDPALVPIMANGCLIRPIDLAALNQIAKLTKGSTPIPGVEFYEESSLAVR